MPSTARSSIPLIETERRMPLLSILIGLAAAPANVPISGPSAAIGPPPLATRDRRECLALLLRRALVQHEADRPVALDHRAWCVQQDGEAETVEPGAPVLPALDVEHEPRVARSLRRPCRQARGRTGTHRIAVARFEVLAADLPLNVRHHRPPLTVRAPVTSRTRAGPWPDRAGGPRSRPAPPARRRSFAQSTRRGARVFRSRPRTR